MSEKSFVQPEDLLKFTFLGQPRVSESGNFICFLKSSMDKESNRYLSDLWIHDCKSSDNRPLTASHRVKAFSWEKNSDKIIFTDGRRDPKKGTSDLFSISPLGGEGEYVGSLDFEVSSIVPLGEGRYVLSGVNQRKSEPLEGADYMVFEQVPFCSNGKGYTAQSRKGLYLYEIGKEPKLLTKETFDTENFRVSQDGGKILATGPDYLDVKPLMSMLVEIDIAPGAVKTLLDGKDFDCHCADYLEGRIVLTGNDQKAHGINQNASFFLLEPSGLKEIKKGLDSGLGNSIGCDCRYGGTDMDRAFYVDGGKIWFVSTDRWESRLHVLDLSGNMETVTSSLTSVDDYHVHKGLGALVGLKGQELQELYVLDEKSGFERQVTSFNSWVQTERRISKPEYLKSGKEPWIIDGWVMKPADFKEGVKYPAIIHIHGGPKTASSDVFFHETQMWASKGYAVAFCNPRGSDGRGNGFDDIRGKYGSIDYDDIMAFADCVAALPFVDETRMGVTGGSYGGYMTNWIIGHTDRFKAAVSQRSKIGRAHV